MNDSSEAPAATLRLATKVPEVLPHLNTALFLVWLAKITGPDNFPSLIRCIPLALRDYVIPTALGAQRRVPGAIAVLHRLVSGYGRKTGKQIETGSGQDRFIHIDLHLMKLLTGLSAFVQPLNPLAPFFFDQ